jgi:hypothetical protein
MSDCCDIPAAGNSNQFIPDEVMIYGLKLNSDKFKQNYGKIDFGEGSPPLVLKLFIEKNSDELRYDEAAIVAAYGYSYEGHCYRFDRQKILAFEFLGSAEAAQGCGFDTPTPAPPSYRAYSMWRIRADTRILELSMNVGSARNIILDANLPGKRAPNTSRSRSTYRSLTRGSSLSGSAFPSNMSTFPTPFRSVTLHLSVLPLSMSYGALVFSE